MRFACYIPLRLIEMPPSHWLVVSRHYPKLHIPGSSPEQALKEAASLVLDGVRALLYHHRLPPGLGEPLEQGEVALHIPLTLASKLALLQGLKSVGAQSNPSACDLLGIGDKHLRTLLDPLRPTKISNIEEQLAKLGVRMTLGFETRDPITD